MIQNDSLSTIIMTCNKNVDLSPLFLSSADLFINSGIQTFICSETPKKEFSLYNTIYANSNSFYRRLLIALKQIKSEYVLILLDDYYIFDNYLTNKCNIWLKELRDNKYDILRISNMDKPFKRRAKQNFDQSFIFIKPQVYDLDFHPTIWKVSCLNKVLSKHFNTAWEIEPYFNTALQKYKYQFGLSSFLIDYKEAVSGGVFFFDAYKKYYLDFNVCSKRKVMSFIKQAYFNIHKGLYHLIPKRFLSKFNKLFRIKSYSK